MQTLTMIDMDRKGAGAGLSLGGGMLVDFIMCGVFAHLAFVRDPQLDFIYAIF